MNMIRASKQLEDLLAIFDQEQNKQQMKKFKEIMEN